MNEEVLAAGNTSQGNKEYIPGDTPRYGAGANIENHPQVTDLVPRKFRVVVLVVCLSLGLGVLAELAAHYAPQWSEKVQVVSAQAITASLADRTVVWASAAMLLLSVGYTRLIFSLRRHRVDDYRGRYRVWRTAGWAAVLLSFAMVSGIHGVAGQIAGELSGWNGLLPNNAGWWLVPAVLLGGWLVFKLAFDASECRTALLAYLVSIGCFASAAVLTAGFSPAWIAEWPDTPGRLLPLFGSTFFFAGCLLFARYVVLDVQGLIEHADSPQLPRVAEATAEGFHAEKSSAQKSEAVAQSLESESEWIDGSEQEETGRKLTKAERKRLRKQKNRKRAA